MLTSLVEEYRFSIDVTIMRSKHKQANGLTKVLQQRFDLIKKVADLQKNVSLQIKL